MTIPAIGSPQLTMLIGAQGSGKTTWMRQHVIDHQATILSTDEIIEDLVAMFGEAYSTVWHTMLGDVEKSLYSKLLTAVARRDNIIVDRTNMSRRSRRKILIHVPGDYVRKAIVFLADRSILLDRIKQRPGKMISEEVLDATLALYEAPALHEFETIEYRKSCPVSIPRPFSKLP